MNRLMHRLLLVAFLLVSGIVQAQGTLAGVNGDCAIGGQQVLTQGLSSSATQQIGTTNALPGAGVMASFPFCSVTVYFTGTSIKAAIFSNNLVTPTPLGNPFNANSDGSWTFFTAVGVCYDVVVSTGTGPVLPYSRPFSDICLGAGGGGGGGSGTVIPGTIKQAAWYGATGNAVYPTSDLTYPGGGIVQIATGMNIGSPNLAVKGTATNVAVVALSTGSVVPTTGWATFRFLTDGLHLSFNALPELLVPVATSPLTIGNPIATSTTYGVASSTALWYADQETGATVDVQVNKCLIKVMTNLGGKCDASALGLTSVGGVETLAAQINVNEPLPPTITLTTGGSLGAALTFKLAYSLISPKGESAVSEEVTVTTDGTCPGSGRCSFLMALPASYPVTNGLIGLASQYKPKMTPAGGAVWTEVDCGLTPVVGTTVTISTACAGAAITLPNPAVELILPASGIWSCTIISPSAYCLKWFERSFVHGSGVGEGQRFAIQGTGTTSVAALCGSDLNAKGGTAYQRGEGFSCNQNGATVAIATISIQNFPDNTYFSNIDAACSGGPVCLLVSGGGGGAGSSFINMHAECSRSTGCIPCQFGTPGAPSPGIAFTTPACVHPGPGLNALQLTGGGGGLTLIETYIEGNKFDTTTPFVDIGTAGAVGPLKILGLNVGAAAAGSTAWVIQIEAGSAQTGMITGLYAAQTTNLINDLFNTKTVICGSPCMYSDPYTWGGTAGPARFNNGVMAPFYSTTATNPAASGILRLTSSQTFGWRNNANTNDVEFSLNGSDNLGWPNGFNVGLNVLAAAFVSNAANSANGGALKLATADAICWRNNANSADQCLGKNVGDNLLFSKDIILGPSGISVLSGIGVGGTPTVVLGAGAGTGATFTLAAPSKDKLGNVLVNMGTGTTPSAILFTLTFSTPFANAAFCVVSSTSAGAPAATSVGGLNVNNFTLNSTSAGALAASTTFSWNYVCSGY